MEKNTVKKMIDCKQRIRKEILEKRAKLKEQQRKKSEVLLTERILGHQWFYLSDVLLCFASYGSEINTEAIWMEALRLEKRVYMPKVISTENGLIMKFFRIYQKEDLTAGYKGIPEPYESDEEFQYDNEEIDKVLMLMPGVAFDVYRNRIGYGKGFYDKYLSDKKALQIRTIGIGFACQLLPEIPCDETDIKPYQVICL